MDPVSSLSSKPPPRVTPTTPKKKALPEGETPVWKVGARRGGPWKGARVGPTAPVERGPSEAARSGSTGPTRAPFQPFTFCEHRGLTKPPARPASAQPLHPPSGSRGLPAFHHPPEHVQFLRPHQRMGSKVACHAQA